MNLFTGFRGYLRGRVVAIWNWLWLQSDVSFRRMCVMASLHAQLAKCETGDCGAIARLNQHMCLVNDSNAMKLPTLFAGVIWKNLPTIDKLDTDSTKLVHRIKRLTPCWLNYASDDRFESDIKDLLGFCEEAHKAK